MRIKTTESIHLETLLQIYAIENASVESAEWEKVLWQNVVSQKHGMSKYLTSVVLR